MSLALQPARIAAAVPPLVMRHRDRFGELQQRHAGCRRGCARRSTVCVRITRTSPVGQRARLAQQRIGNADLADVVQRGGAAQQAGVLGGPADRLARGATTAGRRAGCARSFLRRDIRRRARGARSSRCASIRARACWPVADSSSVRFCLRRSWNSIRLSSRLRTRSSTSTMSNGLVTKSFAPRVSACCRASRDVSPVTTSTGRRSWLISGVSDVEHAEAVDLRHVQVGDHEVRRRRRRAAAAARARSVRPVTEWKPARSSMLRQHPHVGRLHRR